MNIKITCLTPKGKAKTAYKNFDKWFSWFRKPIKGEIIDDGSFYLMYELKNDNEIASFKKKIWKAEKRIRQFYLVLMHLAKRANKLSKKGAWKIEKARAWIMKQLVKKNVNPRQMDDFINALEFGDEDMMTEFLKQEIIIYEVLE